MRKLYAIAAEVYTSKGIPKKTEIEYLHADSVGHAKVLYCCSNPNRMTHRIVAAGPALGYFVEDKKGIVLSAG